MKAAIEDIEKSIKRLEWDGVIKPPDNKKHKLLKSLSQALAVLEAAEKVDKGIGIEFLDEMKFFLIDKDSRDDDFIRSWIQLRNFLESLPDKEGRK